MCNLKRGILFIQFYNGYYTFSSNKLLKKHWEKTYALYFCMNFFPIALNYSSLFLYEQVLLANSAHVCCKNLYHITKDNCQLHNFFFSMDCQVPFQIVFSIELFIILDTFERLLSFMN